MVNNAVVTKIIASKKYSDLLPSTIENVLISKSYSEESLRSKLHQIWGAYYTSRPDFNKLYKKLIAGELDIKSIAKIHSSTKERDLESMEILDEIFNFVGANKSVTDIGCGLNPIFFLERKDFASYLCIDIDNAQQNFFASLFAHFSKDNMKAIVGDALLDKFGRSDVILAFKLLPVLDQISSVQCDSFISNLNCEFLVVTFPNKSLGGKNKGMIDNYKGLYIDRVEELGFDLVHDKQFLNECLYIFKAKPGN